MLSEPLTDTGEDDAALDVSISELRLLLNGYMVSRSELLSSESDLRFED